ncbi:myosin-9-like [Sinocyclocheilus grahami]|uniref:myosin-9-like n=1 Tax=Sinocyclocheilus grahami TaxID=75366 RepID=UPI0007ACBD58|nr:PREDICTED: myosin-9-like [Sinocyclocheilus grahami]
MMTLQAKSDSERAELNKRLTDAVRELERLKARVEDREQEVTTLNRKLQDQRSLEETEVHSLKKHTAALQNTLRDITQTVYAL